MFPPLSNLKNWSRSGGGAFLPLDLVHAMGVTAGVPMDAWVAIVGLVAPDFVLHRGILVIDGLTDLTHVDNLVDSQQERAQYWSSLILLSGVFAVDTDEQAALCSWVAHRVADIWNHRLLVQHPGTAVRAVVMTGEDIAVALDGGTAEVDR
jgi:hypothetical protein